ncbi:MAG: HAD-IIIA family hydrolase [Pseudomonadota bacterium]
MLRQAVVLVGGAGTRLGSLTSDTPKPMLPIHGTPFLEFLLRNIARHGFEDIVLLAHHHVGKIREHFDGSSIGRTKIRVVTEREKAGTGGALREASDVLEDTFLLANGDSVFDFNYLALYQAYLRANVTVAIALREVPDVSRYGHVMLNDKGTVVHFSEKSGNQGQAGLIGGGIYILNRQILEKIRPGNVSLETEILPNLVTENAIIGKQFDGFFLDIGLPKTYSEAQSSIPAWERRKVVFLDRDGTINRDSGYTHMVEDLEFVPDAPEAIRHCNEAGRLVIVVSNQAGIARGFYSAEDVDTFHKAINIQLQNHGAHIDAFYYCPHHPEGTVANLSKVCDCRKPGTKMLEDACRDWPINLEGAVLIGDKKSDLDAATAFGIRGLLTDGTDLMECIQKADL